MMNLDSFAAALIDAHGTNSRFVPDLPQLSQADIRAVQARVSAALGPVAGFKIGRAIDGTPSLAPIAARYVVADGGTRTVRDRLGIELELGFEIIAPIPRGGLPARPERHVRPCVVLELVDPRLKGAEAERPDLKLADFQINAGLVVGARLEDWDGSDFRLLRAHLRSADRVVMDGPVTVPGGSALASLELLLVSLGDHCGGLQVGQTVITGSVCGLPWFTPDADITGRIGGLGDVSVRLRGT
ncbi:hydratase [Rhodobacterales bacterium HKCCSP123]|nr:hydratase [Rhodobacterales bacterium HKCCSP123]